MPENNACLAVIDNRDDIDAGIPEFKVDRSDTIKILPFRQDGKG